MDEQGQRGPGEVPPWWRRLRPDHAWALLIGLAVAAVLAHDWDGFVFERAVRDFWAGHSPYGIAHEQPYYAFLGPSDTITQWYAYPPVPLLAMAASFAPAIFLDVPEPVQRMLLKLPMVLATIALALVAAAWTRRLGLTPEETVRIERRFLFNPFLFLVGAAWGMTDTALMAFFMGGLLAYRNGKPGKAGALVALAALIKPFPVLLLLPIVPYLLDQHGWRSFGRFTLGGAAVAIPILAPFIATQPAGFWDQVVAMHLERPPQGVTPWTLWPLDRLPDTTITVASLTLMCVSLLAVGWIATRLRGRGTTLMLTLLAGIAVLVWNRVLNEQYLVLVVAPLLILDQVHALDRFGHFLTRWIPAFFAVLIAIGGFHFLTFIPPDIAMPLFGKSVDAVADELRQGAPWFWWLLQNVLETLVILSLVALAVLAVRLVRRQIVAQDPASPVHHHFTPIAAAVALLLVIGVVPALAGPAHVATTDAFEPAYEEPLVAAFYYLWWQNPSHDRDIQYGNWGPVSQTPTMGYYTNTRGVARDHARQMVDAGIDTAIVSYHRGEHDRYRTFQEEAAKVGLRVVPLIELNQVYDQPRHHPTNETGGLQPFAAYRLDDGTRQAIVEFTLDLDEMVLDDANLRLDGKPVVMYYDSYPSTVGFDPEDKENLANVLLDLYDLPTLRRAFNDTTMGHTLEGVLRHYPQKYQDFFNEGSSALWRTAHLEEHRRFWSAIRVQLESELGPLTLISGESFNDRAGFEAGTVKAITDLEIFDGAFIYSPSFTWGNAPKAPFADNLVRWEDRNHWQNAFAAGLGKASIIGIAPAYDDTVNRPLGFRIPATVEGRSFYDISWQSMREHPPTMVGVATWNEFFEGSGIEATVEYGDALLGATEAGRELLEAEPRADHTILVVMHERDSRLHEQYSERDPAHDAGLQLIGATFRAAPDSTIAAVDARTTQVAVEPHVVLVEGGHGTFAPSRELLDRLAQLRGDGVPIVVFGPDPAKGLALDCPRAPQAPPGPVTLQPGDRLTATAEGLTLARGAGEHLVGVRCTGGAMTDFKPWSLELGGRPDCLAVALKALVPEHAPARAGTSCTA